MHRAIMNHFVSHRAIGYNTARRPAIAPHR